MAAVEDRADEQHATGTADWRLATSDRASPPEPQPRAGITWIFVAGTSSRSMSSRCENSEIVTTARRVAPIDCVSQRRRAPSRSVNHSGCATNDRSWMATTVGTPSAAARCRPARTRRRGDRPPPRAAAAPAPTRCRRPPGDRPGGEAARIERQRDRLGARRARTRGSRARGVCRPFVQQPAEIPADAGRPAARARGRRCRCAWLRGPAARWRARYASNTRRAVSSQRKARERGDTLLPRRPCASVSSSSTRAIARAMSSGSSGSTSTPAPPSTSGSEPRLAATTGTPSVIASSTGKPKPSSNDGCTSSRAPSYSARRCVRVDVADVADVALQRRPVRCDRARARASAVARPASEPSSRHASPVVPVRAATRQQPLVGVEQAADVLPRLERAEEQHIAVFRRGRPRASSRARRADRRHIRSRGTPSSRSTSPRGVLRRHDDRVGAVRVRRAPAPDSRGESRRGCARDASGSSGRES